MTATRRSTPTRDQNVLTPVSSRTSGRAMRTRANRGPALEVKLDEPRGRVGCRVRMEGLYAARRDADVSRDRVAASQDIDSEERVEMEDFRGYARIPCEGAGRIEVGGGPHRPGPDDEDSRDNGHMPPAGPAGGGAGAG